MNQDPNFDRHIILYAKGHYKQSNAMADLKKLYSIRNAIDTKYLSDSLIIEMLLELTFPYIHHAQNFVAFIIKLEPEYFYGTDDLKYTFEELVVNRCLSVLRLTHVKNFPFELSEADPNILPLK